ncbi:hypothetical protein O181_011980 [Austropuccinia psidii MF-1]|uniref:CCHC-type domain-containing protein n=1 Tax=Austropuccinia psidii MF-1 TaxID=1389203 RepID=A0A9Q3BW71_9BASI|nr:hypothetical protein [Austropuccinia psidii MF-1]
MSYSEKEALKQLPEASSWTKFSGTGEHDHMELSDYIDGLLIDVPSIPDYGITAILNTVFEGNSSIWYIEMKELHGRRSWQRWKSQIIQEYMAKYHMGNHKLLTQMPGELEHIVKCRCNQSCTLDYIANPLKDVRKIKNIGSYSQFRSSIFKEKQAFRVDFKHKPKGKMEEVTKKKNTCHNCGSKYHYTNNCQKVKKKVYALEQVPDEESPTEDSEP